MHLEAAPGPSMAATLAVPSERGVPSGWRPQRQCPTAWVRPLALAAWMVALAACGTAARPVMTGVQVNAAAPSPATRGAANQFDVTYRLAGPAVVSARIEAPDGRTWSVYEARPRPAGGDYRLAFDGTVAGPGPNERRVLPDGEYRVVLEAASGGRTARSAVTIPIRNADVVPPEIQNLVVLPDRISPNADARDDVTRVTYRVTKNARATPFADRVLADGSRERAWTGEQRAVEAGEQGFVWDGMLGSVPLPSGSYEFGVRAADDAGNVSEERTPLAIEGSGVPDAKIVLAIISPREIVRGNQVCLDAVVRNTGPTVLRTQGPDPGYVYNSLDLYSSIEGNRYPERAGYWRIGLDWAGAPSTAGARYPYRWGFGKDLQPGEEVSVKGCVRVNSEQTKMIFFAGLLQENVATRDAGIGQAEVRVSS